MFLYSMSMIHLVLFMEVKGEPGACLGAFTKLLTFRALASEVSALNHENGAKARASVVYLFILLILSFFIIYNFYLKSLL